MSWKITILVDGEREKSPLMTEHGFSAWIEYDCTNILFDTGQGPALRANASLLDIDIARADAIVLSHGHYDHGDGLDTVLEVNRQAPVFLHGDACLPRYSFSTGTPRYVGLAQNVKTALCAQPDRIRWSGMPVRIVEGVWVTGPVPRHHRESRGAFFRDSDATLIDPIMDDQALVLMHERRAYIVTGCAHSGVENIVGYVEKTFQAPIGGIVGGLHLHNASSEELSTVMSRLQKHSPRMICAGHCTGAKAMARLKKVFGSRFRESRVGSVIESGRIRE